MTRDDKIKMIEKLNIEKQKIINNVSKYATLLHIFLKHSQHKNIDKISKLSERINRKNRILKNKAISDHIVKLLNSINLSYNTKITKEELKNIDVDFKIEELLRKFNSINSKDAILDVLNLYISSLQSLKNIDKYIEKVKKEKIESNNKNNDNENNIKPIERNSKEEITTTRIRYEYDNKSINRNNEGKYDYTVGGVNYKTNNPAIYARYKAQQRFFNLSTFEQSLYKLNGDWKEFERLWDLAAAALSITEQLDIASLLDELFTTIKKDKNEDVKEEKDQKIVKEEIIKDRESDKLNYNDDDRKIDIKISNDPIYEGIFDEKTSEIIKDDITTVGDNSNIDIKTDTGLNDYFNGINITNNNSKDIKRDINLDEKEIINSLIYASECSVLDEKIAELTDDGVKELIEHRLKRLFGKMDTIKYGAGTEERKSIKEQMAFDFEIIKEAIKQGVDFTGDDINVGYLLGDKNYHDIKGVIKKYYSQVKDANLLDNEMIDYISDAVQFIEENKNNKKERPVNKKRQDLEDMFKEEDTINITKGNVL